MCKSPDVSLQDELHNTNQPIENRSTFNTCNSSLAHITCTTKLINTAAERQLLSLVVTVHVFADCDVTCDVVARGCCCWEWYTAVVMQRSGRLHSHAVCDCTAGTAVAHVMTQQRPFTCCSHAEPSTGSINHFALCNDTSPAASINDIIMAPSHESQCKNNWRPVVKYHVKRCVRSCLLIVAISTKCKSRFELRGP